MYGVVPITVYDETEIYASAIQKFPLQSIWHRQSRL